MVVNNVSYALVTDPKCADDVGPNDSLPTANSPCQLASPSTPRSAPSLPSQPSSSFSNWVDDFHIPWNKLPEDTQLELANGKRLSSSQQRELVRIVVLDIVKVSLRPGRKALAVIAEKMVCKHPASLKDVLCSDTIGTGSYSLMKRLESRVENSTRTQAKTVRDTIGIPIKRKCIHIYGCLNAFPTERGHQETEESEMKKKADMQQMWNSGECETSEQISSLMTATYYAQRQCINSRRLTTSELCAEWPYLFQAGGMETHYDQLLGTSFQNISNELDSKGLQIIRYMKSLKIHQAVQKIVLDIEKAKLELGNDQPLLIGVILLLVAFFKEEINRMFKAIR